MYAPLLMYAITQGRCTISVIDANTITVQTITWTHIIMAIISLRE